MDSDSFDDDIPDEDFLTALAQASSSNGCQPSSSSKSVIPKGGASLRTPVQSDGPGVDLDDLPSDAFDSPESSVEITAFSNVSNRASNAPSRQGLARTGSGHFRQTTLFGKDLTLGEIQHQQQHNEQSRGFRADLPPEEPCHHVLDKEAMGTWVYPTNLGAIRDYQYSIVKNSLFNNTLVALPTGLGKTFIAATVMLNFHRWTKDAKIVFVAPTKPLVAQQVDACCNIAGIPRSETTLLTGDIPPAMRVDEWGLRRVFFMTPQTLMNDLSNGYADPKSIGLLVIDEAHRAVGEYAYAKVAKMIRRFSKSIRVLALTATPGSKVETVQEVIDNLGISHCEIRTEESLDIRQYVHQRNTEQVILDPSDEMNLVSQLFSEALKPMLEKLSSQNIWYGRNPMALTAYGLLQAQKEWFSSRGRHANQGVQFMMRAIFTVLTGIAHSVKLLQYHGIKPFYDNMVDLRDEQEGKGEKGSKYKRQLVQNEKFQEMMTKIAGWMKLDGFVGHPKLTELTDRVLNHFMDAGDGSGTRVIVFSEYRDSAEEIMRKLNAHRPLIKASTFVGQADSKRGEGMKQAQQLQTLEKFRKGEFNVLVATSIGEEGLDIGQVDLIICYDSSASPIRMLQRMGRTGRKREGHIVLLLMRGKEEDQFAKSKDNYEKMQKLICEGSRFNFRFDLSSRIVPRDIRPEVDKRHVEIPIENTQDSSLPEPRKRRAAAGKKKPPKKFHMPDGVETGFQKVTDLLKMNKTPTKSPMEIEMEDIVQVPPLKTAILNETELAELNRSYRDLPFNFEIVEETDMPSMTAHPILQRELRPTVAIGHGKTTKRCVKLLRKLGTDVDSLARHDMDQRPSDYLNIDVHSFVDTDNESQNETGSNTATLSKRPRKRRLSTDISSNKAERRSTSHGADHVEEHDDALDGSDTSLAECLPSRKKRRPKTPNKRRRKSNSPNSDEIGDDCQRDSDLLESDGSDDGSDLVDFVVSDNRPISSMPEPPSSQESLEELDMAGQTKQSARPAFVPTEFPATQDSDGLPDLQVVSGPAKASNGQRKPNQGVARRGARKRHVLDKDSESDG